MDQGEINSLVIISKSMESEGDIECWFYLCVRANADGKPDLIHNVSELMQNAPSRLGQQFRQ